MRTQPLRLTTSLALALALLLSGSGLAVADRPDTPQPVLNSRGRIAPLPDAPALAAQEVLYDQSDSPVESGSGVTSQIGTGFTDAQVADDFFLPAGDAGSFWVINTVEVQGFYTKLGNSSAGPANSVNVYIYRDSLTRTTVHVPGTPIFTATSVIPASGLDTGSFVISLNPPLTLTASTTQGELYWLSVQASAPASKGVWQWAERSVQGNNPSASQEISSITGLCYRYWDRRVDNCINGLGPDLLFRVSGVNNLVNAGPVAFQISPGAARAGSADLPLVVVGGNFAAVSGSDGSRISWNGTLLTSTTTVTGTTQVRAVVPFDLLTRAGVAEVRAVNLSNGGATQKASNPQFFTIQNVNLYLPVVQRTAP